MSYLEYVVAAYAVFVVVMAYEFIATSPGPASPGPA